MYLLFDIGATHIRITSSSDHQNLDEIKTFPTPTDFEEGISLITDTALQLSTNDQITKAAGSVRFLDTTKSKIPFHPNINLWPNEPLKERLEKALRIPVTLEKDSALAALGEAVFGAGKDKKIVAYLTISTGVGGARVVEKVIDKNALGFEPGFQIIEDGYLENFISGDGLQKRFGKKPEEITDEKIWDEVCQYLAIGINNTIVFWSPDIVILGGNVTKSIDLEKVKSYLEKALKIFPQKVEVVKSLLNDSGGLHGALALLMASKGT